MQEALTEVKGATGAQPGQEQVIKQWAAMKDLEFKTQHMHEVLQIRYFQKRENKDGPYLHHLASEYRDLSSLVLRKSANPSSNQAMLAHDNKIQLDLRRLTHANLEGVINIKCKYTARSIPMNLKMDARHKLKESILHVQSTRSAEAGLGLRRADAVSHIWKSDDLFALKNQVCYAKIDSIQLKNWKPSSKIQHIQVLLTYGKQRLISTPTIQLDSVNNQQAIPVVGEQVPFSIKDIGQKLKDNEHLSIQNDHFLIVSAYAVDLKGGEEENAGAQQDCMFRTLIGEQKIQGSEIRRIQCTDFSL